MNTIYCSIDSIKSMTNMAVIFNKSQNAQNASNQLNPECLIIICTTCVLIVCIVCLFIYIITNKKKQNTIKTLLEKDEAIRKVIEQHIVSTNKQILNNISEDIWKKKETEMLEKFINEKNNESLVEKYISDEIKKQLPKLIKEALNN